MTFRTFVRPLFVALSLAFASTAAAPAFADDAGGKSAEHAKGKGKNKEKRGKGKEHKFPVDGTKFEKRVDNRLSQAKDKLSSALSKHGVTEAEKTRLLKQFDDGAALVRAAAKRVAKDGQVTKEEAKDVRGLVKNLRKQLKNALPKKADKPVAKDV
jgi:hypothetical protein